MKTALSPRKLPRQSRSQATVDAILDATAQVLVERGYADTSTNAVAQRAGVSVGSLYQYFPNKDALIAALHDRHARQMQAVIERALARHADGSLLEALTGVIESAMEAHRVDADLHQVLERQFLGRAAELHDHDEVEAQLEEQLRRLLQQHREELAVADLKLATFTVMHAVHAVVHAAVRQRPGGVSLKALTRETVALAHAYLTAPRREPAPA
ncbi:TetR/AcrR family transcriptional regulator [Ideonella sp. BN130291]|uniref:TetR/AcrR family transcriptional regulator n=1 Tax=Ideonella sp. BN130291 TaxID=3112940 RepID=UPI002E25BE26|nr:TetR/AcrR family transcriptional regulator [Ideonella sp. BN130291]